MEQEIQIDLAKILEEYIGYDADGDPKAVVFVSLLEIIPDTKVNEKDGFHMVNTVIEHILIQEYFISIALEVSKCNALYQEKFETLIREYHTLHNNGMHFYLSIAGIIETKYQLTLADPLICIRGSSINSPKSDVIQMIFPLQAMNLLENEIDYGKIRAEVEREYEVEEEALQEEYLEEEQNQYPYTWKEKEEDINDSPFIRFTKEE